MRFSSIFEYTATIERLTNLRFCTAENFLPAATWAKIEETCRSRLQHFLITL